MSEPSLLDLFRSRWLESARQFWPESPREQLESELAHLDAELARRQNRLVLCRKKTEKLRYLLKRCEARFAQSATLVEGKQMDGEATAELERQRRSIDHLCERLQTCELRYARQLARLRQRKQQRAELRERLLSGSLPKPTDAASDPDYPF